MKRILLALSLIYCLTASAQSPSKISYQAVVSNLDGSKLVSQALGIQISILEASPSGKVVYSETHQITSDPNGLISLEIGMGTTQHDLSAVDWSNNTYFVKVEIDPDGGSNYSLSITSQLLSVPYAFYADKAGNYDETDPVYSQSIASTITEQQTTSWSNKLEESATASWDKNTEDDFSGDYNDLINTPAIDPDTTNEIQSLTVSITGDTLFLSASNYVIISGISKSNAASPLSNQIDTVAGTVTSNSAQLSAEIIVPSNFAPIDSVGYDISKDENFGTYTRTAIGNTTFNTTVANLEQETTYFIRTFVVTELNSYYSDVAQFTTLIGPLSIGDTHEGGIVFYLDETGQHGLIATPTTTNEQSDAFSSGFSSWGCYGTNITGSDGTAIGTGEQNTLDNINYGCGPSSAADLCYYFPIDGYSDWFLPSKDELLEIHNNISLLTALNLEDQFYWTSSESGDNTAWVVNPVTGVSAEQPKNGNYKIRSIRSF